MHEQTSVRAIIARTETILAHQPEAQPTQLRVRIGELSGVSADGFRSHFSALTAATALDGVELDIHYAEGVDDALATEVVLESLTVSDD